MRLSSHIANTPALKRASVFVLGLLALVSPALAADSVVPISTMPWWFWPMALFITCFFIGIVAGPAGSGGGGPGVARPRGGFSFFFVF